jgi:hypothetical protein
MLFLAELYLPAGTPVAEVAWAARVAALRAAGAGEIPRFILAVFVPPDECCYALYGADSAEQVIAAGGLAGVEFDRVSAAMAVLEPGWPMCVVSRVHCAFLFF